MNNKRKITEQELISVKEKETIITNPETIEAMKEAKWLSQGNGKKYETFEDLWKDVFGHE